MSLEVKVVSLLYQLLPTVKQKSKKKIDLLHILSYNFQTERRRVVKPREETYRQTCEPLVAPCAAEYLESLENNDW